jgi:hypothetical protein
MGWEDQVRFQTAFGLTFIGIVHSFQGLDIGDLKVVPTMFDLACEEQVAIGDAGPVFHAPDTLQSL